MGGTDHVQARTPRKPAHGELTPGQREFLDYLLDPDLGKPKIGEWAKLRGFALKTLQAWKRDPVFVNAWQYRALELKVTPDRIARVVDAMLVAAEGGDVRAAQLVFRYLEDSVPRFGGQVPAAPQKAPEDMSDAELEAALAAEGAS